jgi:hypothetical protein
MAVKSIIIFTFLFLLPEMELKAQQAATDFSILTGPYIGQKSPRYIPEVFMPGIISSNKMWKHSPMAFSPDGTEAYWSTANPLTIYYMKLEKRSMDQT